MKRKNSLHHTLPALQHERDRLEDRITALKARAEDAGMAMNLTRYLRIRQELRETARRLSSVNASIAQLKHAALINRSMPSRRHRSHVEDAA